MSAGSNREAVIGALGMGGLVVLAAIYILLSSTGTPAPVPSAAPTQTRDAVLTRTVLYKSRSGFSVCTRSNLHNCTLTFARSDGGDRATILIGPVDVDPAPECENIRTRAASQCADAGTGPFASTADGSSGPDLTWIRCAASLGFLYRGGPNTRVADPRDEDGRLRAGEAILSCDEGHLSGQFDDTL